MLFSTIGNGFKSDKLPPIRNSEFPNNSFKSLSPILLFLYCVKTPFSVLNHNSPTISHIYHHRFGNPNNKLVIPAFNFKVYSMFTLHAIAYLVEQSIIACATSRMVKKNYPFPDFRIE